MTFATAPAAYAATEFPVGYEGYHTYAEVDAVLDAAVASYGQGPDAILKRYVIGQSFEGRDIWMVKISDNVATDEDEPEVLSESGMHAREHITVEMALYMIRLLTENYGQATPLGDRVTRIVNSTEIWIIPLLNPDGAEYNISDGEFHGWRKNRQVNPGSDKLGIDLNRNWSYMWNCCGGSGADPQSARIAVSTRSRRWRTLSCATSSSVGASTAASGSASFSTGTRTANSSCGRTGSPRRMCRRR